MDPFDRVTQIMPNGDAVDMHRDEARAYREKLSHVKRESVEVSIPKYVIERPLTRDEIIDVFKASWPNADLGDVNAYLMHYKVPVASVIPYPAMPELPEDIPVIRRKSLLSEYEDNKDITKRSREQFCIAGYPAFIPPSALPSMNDSNEAIKAAKERISNVYVG